MDPEADATITPKVETADPADKPAAGSGANGGVHAEEEKAASELTADKVLAKQLAITAIDSITSIPAPEKSNRGQSKTYKHPMVIDLLLAVGLLFAMAGLTVSFVKTYITHSAKTSILQGNYKAAIGILHGSPIPEFFGGAGTDSSEDLLNQALYLDAMEKLDNNRDDQTALQELAKISQNSFYYELAQDQFRKLKMKNDNGSIQPQSIQTPPSELPQQGTTPIMPDKTSLPPQSE